METGLSQSDEELMIAYTGGNAAAFDALVERYRRPVYALVHGFVRDAAAAEDVFQEAFVNVIRGAGTFDPNRRFAPWLFRIAERAALEFLRRGARHRTEPLPGVAEPPAPEHYGPEPSLLRNESHTALARAVARLPEPQRTALFLREAADLPFDEVARIMQQPLNTVLSHHFRALKRLKKMLKPEDAT